MISRLKIALGSGFLGLISLASISYYWFYSASNEIKSANTEKNISLQSIDTTCKTDSKPKQTIAKQETEHAEPQNHIIAFTCQNNELHNQTLPIKGTIPHWLSGKLLRVGPAKFASKKNYASRWFDGCAMLYSFDVSSNGVAYSNRYLQTDYLHQVTQEGKFGMKKESSGGFFSKIGSLVASDSKPTYDNGNSSICILNGKPCAITETPLYTTFDKDTLEDHQRLQFTDKHQPHYACAHPLVDRETGDLYNYMIEFGNTSIYKIYRMEQNSSKRQIISEIKASYPSYMHSFAMSKQYIILIETPLRVNPIDFVMKDLPFFDTYTWKQKQGCLFTVIDKKTGKTVGSYQTDPFFFMHTINAYEENNNLIIDIATYNDPSILYTFDLNTIRASKKLNMPHAFATRFSINLDKKQVTKKTISQYGIELPQINPAYHSAPYTFVYGTHMRNNAGIATNIIKIDITTGAHRTWTAPHCIMNEPIFVAKPGAPQEDDGVLLVVVLDTATDSSFLAILDAKNLSEVARAQLPHHIPFDSHGLFIA